MAFQFVVHMQFKKRHEFIKIHELLWSTLTISIHPYICSVIPLFQLTYTAASHLIIPQDLINTYNNLHYVEHLVILALFLNCILV